MTKQQLREIVLDTETTGLEPSAGHRVIEIGAVELIDKVITGKKFQTYLNPKRNVPDDSYRIHGISTHFLKDKPSFDSVADEFLNFVSDSKLIIHNAAFDIKFLNHELSLIKKPLFEFSIAIDTLKIARDKFPGQKSSLDALCKRFKVDNSHRVFHGALKDAQLLAKVYLFLTDHMEQYNLSIDPKKNKKKYISNNLDRLGNRIEKIKVIEPTELEIEKHNQNVSSF